MLITEMTVNDFCNLLASNAPAPGGGSVAAFEAALGASLITMVCGLTLQSPKYEKYHDNCRKIEAKAREMQNRFLVLMDEDTEKFNMVSAAYKMPKSTDAEKSARSLAIQNALKNCTLPPFEVLSLSRECLGLISELQGSFNTSAASDLGAAAASLQAALQGAWLNVKINIDGLKDREFAEQYEQEGLQILNSSLPLAEKFARSL